MGQARRRKDAGEYPVQTPRPWTTEALVANREKKNISGVPGIYSIWTAVASLVGRKGSRPAAKPLVSPEDSRRSAF